MIVNVFSKISHWKKTIRYKIASVFDSESSKSGPGNAFLARVSLLGRGRYLVFDDAFLPISYVALTSRMQF